MAYATKQIDQQYSAQYQDAAKGCLDSNEDWAGYDSCMASWEEGAQAVSILHAKALALDTAQGRKAYRDSACAWYRAVTVVDALSPVELPAAQTALTSRWRRLC